MEAITVEELQDEAERIAFDRGDADAAAVIAGGWLPGMAPPDVPGPCRRRVRAAFAQAMVELRAARANELKERLYG